MVRLALIITVVGLASCAAGVVQLSPTGQAVKIGQSDPAESCKELQSIAGGVSMSKASMSIGGCAGIDSAKNDIRNKAAELGATYVRIDASDMCQISGTAFVCTD